MPFQKTANAPILDPYISLPDWYKLFHRKGTKTASFNKVAADQTTSYLLTHVSIMSSVMCEEPDDFPIKPECSFLVNQNGDAWSNDVLLQSYKTFVGGFNFVEHFQNSKESKGHIFDAVARKVTIAPEVWVWFIDLLVGTDLKHEKLVEDIKAEKFKYLSMGCVCSLVHCSVCGKKVYDEKDFCHHLKYQKGNFIDDDEGVARIVCELCGDRNIPGSVRFVECSWVGTPAFSGAVTRSIVSEEFVGPKTPYTQANHKNSKEAFAKSASGIGLSIVRGKSKFQNHNLKLATDAELRNRLR